jgi:hypothetical protein
LLARRIFIVIESYFVLERKLTFIVKIRAGAAVGHGLLALRLFDEKCDRGTQV